ncbi:hypothetical protein V6N11_025922 [Hibiscus sabdariffa]|uniref:Uncharacterized protein n=1 Tax=Hibiscus sabdariffa TaxID=183260 RepID=A0ABR2SUR8_9ROSI
MLFDLNVEGEFCDIPNPISAAVVELVGHALMNGVVYLDVDIVVDLVGPEVSRQRNVTLLSEGSRERIPCSRVDIVTDCLVFKSAPETLGAVRQQKTRLHRPRRDGARWAMLGERFYLGSRSC